MANRFLMDAKRAKNDEFYTRLEDIEAELCYYRDYFRGKSVYCNCDDPDRSMFWRFFQEHFVELGLTRLTATCFVPGEHGRGRVLLSNGAGQSFQLSGDGDFRSSECIALLKQADLVITNPPFSLFREYVSQLTTYGKQFLIVGNMNAVTYKEIFPLIRQNQMWLGVRPLSRDMYFYVPEERQQWFLCHKKEGSAYKVIDGTVMGRLALACWFTNLDHAKRHVMLDLQGNFYHGHEARYPSYDNYDAIEVSRVSSIPGDYDGVMGVPITFLDRYNPLQFEILGHEHDLRGDGGAGISGGQFEVHGRGVYKRILIRRRVGVSDAGDERSCFG